MPSSQAAGLTGFRRLSVRSNEQLDELVDQAQQIVRGVRPQTLRDNGQLRQQISARLTNNNKQEEAP